MRRGTIRSIRILAALAAVVCMAEPALAASLNGLKLMQAQGTTTFPGLPREPDNPGFLTLTGLVDFNANGGAKTVAITLNYNSPTDTFGAILCKLNTPSDVTDEFDQSTGVGTFTLKVGKNDACITPHDGKPFVPDSGSTQGPITFDLYHGTGSARIASTASAILDGNSNVINIVNVTGSIVPAHANGP